MPEVVAVVGVGCDGAPLAPAASGALAGADLVVGAARHLEALGGAGPGRSRTVVLGTGGSDLAAALDRVAAETGRVCILASGDPGFFGVLRVVSARFARATLEVHPAVSSVGAAFGRVGLSWDDAAVVSAHGRPLDAAVGALLGARKAAVLVSPDNPPEAVGKALLAAGASFGRVHICSRLGSPGETVVATDLAGLAGGSWDPLSVVVLTEGPAPAGAGATHPGPGTAERPSLAWGLPEERFDHRDGMITKAEVRAVVLGKLGVPLRGVLWDVGAGSGSIAVEAARLAPGLDVYAIERDAAEAERVRRNAADHGVHVHVVEGAAPAALADLPDPDRAVVGGGGTPVLDAVLGRLRTGGRLVATYAALDRAAEAEARLGHLVQVGLSRGRRLPDGGLRLAAENPVFVVWGPEP